MRRQAEIGDWAERILALIPPSDEARVVFWLAWAAERYVQAGDRDAYERLIRGYGYADHPLIRFTRAALHGDGEVLCACSPPAVAWLREQGENHAADLIELVGTAAGLLTPGRFDELYALTSVMAQRHQTHGPPTLLYFAWGMRGYSGAATRQAGRRQPALHESRQC